MIIGQTTLVTISQMPFLALGLIFSFLASYISSIPNITIEFAVVKYMDPKMDKNPVVEKTRPKIGDIINPIILPITIANKAGNRKSNTWTRLFSFIIWQPYLG